MWIFALILMIAVILTDAIKLKKKKIKKNLKCLNLSDIDRLLAKLYTYGESGRDFPTNFEQFITYCNESSIMTNDFESYVSQCVDNNFTKNMLTVLVHTIRREVRNQCKPNMGNIPTTQASKKQTKLFESAECANSVKPEHQQCINQTLYILQDSIEILDPKEKLGFICCNMNKFDECLYDRMLKGESKYCSEETAQTSTDFLQSVQGNMLNFLCQEFNVESDICDRHRVDEAKSTSSKYKSIAFPLIESLATVSITRGEVSDPEILESKAASRSLNPIRY